MSIVSLFLVNILFAILWMLLWGAFDLYTLAAGFVLGYLMLAVVGGAMPQGRAYAAKVLRLLSFTGYFFKILIQSNLQVAREVITPGLGMSPRFIRFPVAGLSDFELTSFANTITLTPGTLSVDVSPDGSYLYVHCMYAKDPQQAADDLRSLLDRMKKEFFA